MMKRLVLSLLALALWPACYSKYEGEMMRKDVDALKSQVADMQKSNVDLTKMTEEARQQVATLKGILEEATKLTTRNSADFGLQVQKLQQDLAVLTGRVDEIAHALDAQTKDLQAWRAQVEVKLETAGKGTPTVTQPNTPADKDALFTAGRDKFQSGDQEEARRLLRQFITQYPSDPRASQAQLLHGDSYFAQKKYAAAIGEFQKVVDNYPKSPQVEDALYKIGLAFYELHYCTDARTFLAETQKRFPKTHYAASIHKTLGDITKNAKNRKMCSN